MIALQSVVCYAVKHPHKYNTVKRLLDPEKNDGSDGAYLREKDIYKIKY